MDYALFGVRRRTAPVLLLFFIAFLIAHPSLLAASESCSMLAEMPGRVRPERAGRIGRFRGLRCEGGVLRRLRGDAGPVLYRFDGCEELRPCQLLPPVKALSEGFGKPRTCQNFECAQVRSDRVVTWEALQSRTPSVV